MNEQQLAVVKQALEALEKAPLRKLTTRQINEMVAEHDMNNLERYWYELGILEAQAAHGITTAPAFQPVPNGPYSAPIKELWPVAPKPWVGLTDEEKASLANSVDYDEYYLLVENVEAKLKAKNERKEKNHA
jgi:hypothetical protein